MIFAIAACAASLRWADIELRRDRLLAHWSTSADAGTSAVGASHMLAQQALECAKDAVVMSDAKGTITDKTPNQLKMPYALWTRAAVAQLIELQFGIRLPVRTMGTLGSSG